MHLSRVAFISRGASAALRERGVGDVEALAERPPEDPAFGSHHVLKATRTVVSGRAEALGTGLAIIPKDSGTSAVMPKWTDLRIFLSADFDVGSAITFSFGIKAFWLEPRPYGSTNPAPRQKRSWQAESFVVDLKDLESERRELLAFLGRIGSILDEAYGLDNQTTVQFYLWDSLQFEHLSRVVGRHLEAVLGRRGVWELAWLFPPEDLLQNPRLSTRQSPVTTVRDVVRAALAAPVPHERALAIRDDVGFFQDVRAAFAKTTTTGRAAEDLDLAVGQLVSRSISSAEVLDIFAAAGLKNPDISILSDEFLEEVRESKQKNLAVEMLEKLLNDQIKARARTNVVQSRSFADMLEKAVNQYRNRSLETAEVIQELIELAKQLRAAHRRGEDLGLTEDEVAFYDALETNDSAVAVLDDESLKTIARELVETVRRNATVDWTLREDARANMRRMVKRILRRHGYPPDKQQAATQTVLEQAEFLDASGAAA